jgi:hypothetical protein
MKWNFINPGYAVKDGTPAFGLHVRDLYVLIRDSIYHHFILLCNFARNHSSGEMEV